MTGPSYQVVVSFRQTSEHATAATTTEAPDDPATSQP